MFRRSDFILSFGLRKIISENIIKKLKKPIFNIHLSYLPFNRGAHPNFWSFIENTPAGVSIQ
jgi:methionyl-tRNA formyltransferase